MSGCQYKKDIVGVLNQYCYSVPDVFKYDTRVWNMGPERRLKKNLGYLDKRKYSLSA